MKSQADVHFVFGDLHGMVSSIALMARLSAMRNDDLLRLRLAIDAMATASPGALAWLEHAVGWEQDRRAGYHYPLRGPTESRDLERVDRIAAVDMLTTKFGDNPQIGSLIDLVSMILDGGPSTRHQRLRHGYRSAA